MAYCKFYAAVEEMSCEVRDLRNIDLDAKNGQDSRESEFHKIFPGLNSGILAQCYERSLQHSFTRQADVYVPLHRLK